MNLRFIERDGKKVLQKAHDYHGYETWADVPCVVEKKEQMKLWEVLRDASPVWPHSDVSKHQASAVIDTVIECYYQWKKDYCTTDATFPEYLKEKLGNE